LGFVETANASLAVAEKNPSNIRQFFLDNIAFLHFIASESRKTRFVPPQRTPIFPKKDVFSTWKREQEKQVEKNLVSR